MASDNVAALVLELQNAQFNSGLGQSKAAVGHFGDAASAAKGQADAMGAAMKSAAGAMAGLFVGSKLVGVFRNVVTAASGLSDTTEKFKRVFSEVGLEAEAMSLSLQNNFRRSAGAAMDMLLANGNLFTSMGLSQRAALGYSNQLSELSVQLAAFFNTSAESVSGAFASAMQGNTRSLRQYGVMITDAALKTEMLAQAKRGLVFVSEQEAKTSATLAIATRQASNAITSFASVGNRLSEQTRKFAENIGDLKESLGAAFLTPVTKTFSVLNNSIESFNKLDKGTIAVISTLGFGAIAFGTFGAAATIVTGLIRQQAAILSIDQTLKGTNTSATAALATAETSATAATAAATAALNIETAALSANTAAKVGNRTATAARANVLLASSTNRVARTATSINQAGTYAQASNTGQFGGLLRAQAMNDRKAQLLANIAANRAATASSGFGSFSRGVDQAAATREATRVARLDALAVAARTPGMAGMSTVATARIPGALTRSVGSQALSGASIVTKPLGMVGGLFTKLSRTLTPLITSVVRFIPFLGRLAPLFGSILGPVGAIVGMGSAIYGALKFFKHLPMIFEYFLDYVSSAFTWENIKAGVMKGLKTIWAGIAGAFSLIGQAAAGLFEFGNRIAGMIFGYTTASKELYDSQKKTLRLESEMVKRREALLQQQRDQAIMQGKILETEQNWADLQERLSKQREETAIGMMSDAKRLGALQSQADEANSKVAEMTTKRMRLVEDEKRLAQGKLDASAAVRGLGIGEDSPLRQQFSEMLEATKGDMSQYESWKMKNVNDKDRGKFDILRSEQTASAASDSATAALRSSESEIEKYGTEAEKKFGEIFKARLDLAKGVEDPSARISSLRKIYEDLKASGRETSLIEQELDKEENDYWKAMVDRRDRLSGDLYDLNFGSASRNQQGLMTRNRFNDLASQFDSTTGFDEREKLLSQLKGEYDKAAGDSSTDWFRGVRSGSASANESGTAAAKEMQNRIFNDLDKQVFENQKRQTELQKKLVALMQQMVDDTETEIPIFATIN